MVDVLLFEKRKKETFVTPACLDFLPSPGTHIFWEDGVYKVLNVEPAFDEGGEPFVDVKFITNARSGVSTTYAC